MPSGNALAGTAAVDSAAPAISPTAAARAAKKAKAKRKLLRASASPKKATFTTEASLQHSLNSVKKAAAAAAGSAKASDSTAPAADKAAHSKPISPNSTNTAVSGAGIASKPNGVATSSAEVSGSETTGAVLPGSTRPGSSVATAAAGSEATVTRASSERLNGVGDGSEDPTTTAQSLSHQAAGAHVGVSNNTVSSPPSKYQNRLLSFVVWFQSFAGAYLSTSTRPNAAHASTGPNSATKPDMAVLQPRPIDPSNDRGRKRFNETAAGVAFSSVVQEDSSTGSHVRAPSRTSGRQVERFANGIAPRSFAKKPRAKAVATSSGKTALSRQSQGDSHDGTHGKSGAADSTAESIDAGSLAPSANVLHRSQLLRAGSCPADPAATLYALLTFSQENPFSFKLDPRLAPRSSQSHTEAVARLPPPEIMRAVQKAQLKNGRIVKSSNVEYLQTADAAAASRLPKAINNGTARNSAGPSQSASQRLNRSPHKKPRIAPDLSEVVPRARKRSTKQPLGPLPVLKDADHHDASSRAASIAATDATAERDRAASSSAQPAAVGDKRSREQSDEGESAAPPKKRGWAGWAMVPEDSIQPSKFSLIPEPPVSRNRPRSTDTASSRRSRSRQNPPAASPTTAVTSDDGVAASASGPAPLPPVPETVERKPTLTSATRRAASPRVRDYAVGASSRADDSAMQGVSQTGAEIGPVAPASGVSGESKSAGLPPSAAMPHASESALVTGKNYSAGGPNHSVQPSTASTLLASRGKQALGIIPPPVRNSSLVIQGGSSPRVVTGSLAVMSLNHATASRYSPSAAHSRAVSIDEGGQGWRAGVAGTAAAAVDAVPPQSRPGSTLAASTGAAHVVAAPAGPAPTGRQAWLAALAARAQAARAESQPRPVTLERSARQSSRDASSPLTTAPEEYDGGGASGGGQQRSPLVQTITVLPLPPASQPPRHSSPLTAGPDDADRSGAGRSPLAQSFASESKQAAAGADPAAQATTNDQARARSSGPRTSKSDDRGKCTELGVGGGIASSRAATPASSARGSPLPDSAVVTHLTAGASSKALGKRPEKAKSASPAPALAPKAASAAPPSVRPALGSSNLGVPAPGSSELARNSAPPTTGAPAPSITTTFRRGAGHIAYIPIDPATGKVAVPPPRANGWAYVDEEELPPRLFEQSTIITGKRSRRPADYREK